MKNLQLLTTLLKSKKTFLLTTHIHPDADGLGSMLALGMALKKMKKQVFILLEEPLPKRYHYLDHLKMARSFKEEQKTPLLPKKIDLYIVLDAHDLSRVGQNMGDLALKQECFFIDHHPWGEESRQEGFYHCFEKKAAATGEMVVKIIKKLNIVFDREMALCLYTAILIDTSSFRYPTVTSQTHRLIGELLCIGPNPARAYDLIYGTKKLAHLQLLGEVLSKAQSSTLGKIAWMVIREDLLKRYGVEAEETISFVNYLLVLEGVKVAILFREVGDEIWVALRSPGHIDVSKVALHFGGGGHAHSAALRLKRQQISLKKLIEDVLKETKKALL